MIGCDKSSDVDPSNQAVPEMNIAKSSYRIIVCNDTWLSPPVDQTITDCFCAGTGGNCLPTVTIYGVSAPNDLEKFTDAVESNETDVYFIGSEHKKVFGNSISENHLAGLRSGELTFSLLPTTSVSVMAAMHYFSDIITKDNADSDAILTYPLDLN